MFCFLFLFVTSAGFAQPKAPGPVEEALRARVTKFYQAHVDRKFRLADEVVAEESKDAFFEQAKPAYRSFEIRNITYSKKFKEAIVTTRVQTTMMMPGVGEIPSTRDLPSQWKIVGGKWFMVIPAQTATPFGAMRSATGAAPSALPPGLKPGHDFSTPLRASPNEVHLSTGSPAQEVTVTNSLGATVALIAEVPAVPGLSVKLDRDTLKAEESAKLLIQWQKQDKMPASPVNVLIKLKQLPFATPVKVVFSDEK